MDKKNVVLAASGVTIVILGTVCIQQTSELTRLKRGYNRQRQFIKLMDRVVDMLFDNIPEGMMEVPEQLRTDLDAWTIMRKNGII